MSVEMLRSRKGITHQIRDNYGLLSLVLVHGFGLCFRFVHLIKA